MTERAVATNRQARRDFFILETLEAGLQLKGSEVKSLRARKANLKDSFARIEGGEAILYNMHITPYEQTGVFDLPEPKRPRKLLLHKEQIKRLVGSLSQKGLTLIPLKVYFRRGFAKVELGLAKGKKLYDKRQELRKKEHEMEVKRVLRGKK